MWKPGLSAGASVFEPELMWMLGGGFLDVIVGPSRGSATVFFEPQAVTPMMAHAMANRRNVNFLYVFISSWYLVVCNE